MRQLCQLKSAPMTANAQAKMQPTHLALCPILTSAGSFLGFSRALNLAVFGSGTCLIGPCQAAGGPTAGLTTERNIMVQRANPEEAPHPLHEAYACLLSNGLDGAA